MFWQAQDASGTGHEARAEKSRQALQAGCKLLHGCVHGTAYCTKCMIRFQPSPPRWQDARGPCLPLPTSFPEVDEDILKKQAEVRHCAHVET